jgi:hypothetical protein
MKRIMLNVFGALAASLALNLQLSTALAQITTFTNPTPAGRLFGYRMAVVGTDRVLIGVSVRDLNVSLLRAAYLLNTNGALLTTFTNPAPPKAGDDGFSISVAAVGSDRVLIGAYYDDRGATDAGDAYLFSANGALLKTFTNPTPAASDWFGISAAALGTDRVLIGATGDDTGATDAGASYLFSTNGALLTTFTNPTPAASDWFGQFVAAVGNDRVLIGAHRDDTGATDAGAAYLFSPDGAWLTTFTNPTPAANDWFGLPVAAVGTDRVLIGAYGDDTGATDAGAAYLFSTNGALLTTFTNPTPAVNDYFGYCMAAVGSDRVLIGAVQDDTGATDAGAAYLFSTDGTLLTTFTNPTPANSDDFGYSVAAVGTDRALIGSPWDDTGALNTGAAYLFSLAVQTSGAPSLTILLTTTNTVAVSWPFSATGWLLQENTNGVASVNWSNAPGTILDDGTNKTLIVNPPAGNRFYRLFKP